MHAAHQLVVVGVEREHRVALVHFAGVLVRPDVPEACQTPRSAIRAAELPPDLFARCLIWFVERCRRDDAALSALPRVLVAGLLRQLIAAGTVGREVEPWAPWRTRESVPTGLQPARAHTPLNDARAG